MLWHLPSCEVIGTLRGHEHVVECIAFCNDAHDAEFHKKALVGTLAVGSTVVGWSVFVSPFHVPWFAVCCSGRGEGRHPSH
jgi:hypothetical protein